MSWLRKKFKNWLYADESYGASKVISVDSISNSVEAEPVLNFRVYSANNGKIIEFSTYDRLKDRTNRSVYVCSPDDDIGEKISKYVNLELLR